MTARHWTFLACISLLATFSACGDDSEDAGGGGGSAVVDTGLPSGDKLSSLDEDDAQQACMSTAESFNSVLSDSELERVACAITAISQLLTDNGGEIGPSNISECKKIQNDCLDGKIGGEKVEIDPQVVDESDCDSASASGTFSDCDATVAEYESCASRVASELKTYFKAITCDALKDTNDLKATLNAEIDVSDAPQCKALQKKCPNVDLSGTGDSGDEGDEEE